MRRAIPIVVAMLALTLSPHAAVASDRVDSRIIDGEAAPVGAWPSIAYLRINFPGVGTGACGGTLIAPTIIQTAAHCLTFVDGGSVRRNAGAALSTARVGVVDRLALPTYAWSSYVIHPDYKDGDGLSVPVNDVALIQLAAPPAGVPPAPLVSPWFDTRVVAGAPAFTAGWGRTIWNVATLPRYLRETGVPIVGSELCGSIWVQYEAESMVCAGGPPTTPDSCRGDSGGPLSMEFDGARYVVGTTSWGALQCGNGVTPGVYGRLSAFREWILDGTTPESIAVRTYLQGTTAQPSMRVTNAGPDVSVTWTVDASNWTTTGFNVTVDGAQSTVTTHPATVTRRITSGAPVEASVEAIVTLGGGGTATFAGTPTPTRPPIVTAPLSGTPTAGAMLTATGTSDDPWAQTLTYQWRRDGRPIRGATAATYVVTRADAGREITVTVSAANAVGAGTATSEPTARATAAAQPAGTTTRILGVRGVGHVLRASAPRATGYPAPAVRYQWLRNGRAIPRATKAHYRLARADAGRSIRVRVTYANPLGRRTLESRATRVDSVIRSFPPRPISRTVTLTGTPSVGSTLRATAPVAGGYPTPTVRYQWLRNGSPIPRATRATYRLTAADRGRGVRVRVTYANSLGQRTLQSRALNVR